MEDGKFRVYTSEYLGGANWDAITSFEFFGRLLKLLPGEIVHVERSIYTESRPMQFVEALKCKADEMQRTNDAKDRREILIKMEAMQFRLNQIQTTLDGMMWRTR